MAAGVDLTKCTGFQWDAGNATKSWESRHVSQAEGEQIFFNKPLLVTDDVKHLQDESRPFALGRTNARRGLFVVFTVQGDLIRVISARDMSRAERRAYAHAQE
jgi:uncharacterized DUF497 family protein